MFDFGTKFFSNENYAKHLVRTIPLGKYANDLSVACQEKGEEGPGRVLVDGTCSSEPFPCRQEPARRGVWKKVVDWATLSKQPSTQLKQHSGFLPPGPLQAPSRPGLSDFSRVAVIGVSSPRKSTQRLSEDLLLGEVELTSPPGPAVKSLEPNRRMFME